MYDLSNAMTILLLSDDDTGYNEKLCEAYLCGSIIIDTSNEANWPMKLS